MKKLASILLVLLVLVLTACAMQEVTVNTPGEGEEEEEAQTAVVEEPEVVKEGGIVEIEGLARMETLSMHTEFMGQKGAWNAWYKTQKGSPYYESISTVWVEYYATFDNAEHAQFCYDCAVEEEIPEAKPEYICSWMKAGYYTGYRGPAYVNYPDGLKVCATKNNAFILLKIQGRDTFPGREAWPQIDIPYQFTEDAAKLAVIVANAYLGS